MHLISLIFALSFIDPRTTLVRFEKSINRFGNVIVGEEEGRNNNVDNYTTDEGKREEKNEGDNLFSFTFGRE